MYDMFQTKVRFIEKTAVIIGAKQNHVKQSTLQTSVIRTCSSGYECEKQNKRNLKEIKSLD